MNDDTIDVKLDLDHYCWRERTTDEDGNERLLIPHSDPMEHEWPIDQIFKSPEDAKKFLNEQYPGEKLVLVHYVGTVVEEYEAPEEQH